MRKPTQTKITLKIYLFSNNIIPDYSKKNKLIAPMHGFRQVTATDILDEV